MDERIQDQEDNIWEEDGSETLAHFLFDSDDKKDAPRDLSLSKPVLVIFDRKDLNVWHPLESKETVVGREGDIDLVIPDETISRGHAKIIYQNLGKAESPVCFLQDMGSRNGTFLNGRKVEGMEQLANGDRIFLGKTCLVYYLRTEEEIHTDKKIRAMATRDALTGLLNRGFMIMQFQREFDRAVRYKRPLTLMMIDLDNFKSINDTYGHQVGDTILEQTAQMVASRIRVHDVAGRYGGEEFAVLLPETDLDGAKIMAERVREGIEKHLFISRDYELNMTISVGVSLVDFVADRNIEALIHRADMALLEAKRKGKNRCVIHEPGSKA